MTVAEVLVLTIFCGGNAGVLLVTSEAMLSGLFFVVGLIAWIRMGDLGILGTGKVFLYVLLLSVGIGAVTWPWVWKSDMGTVVEAAKSSEGRGNRYWWGRRDPLSKVLFHLHPPEVEISDAQDKESGTDEGQWKPVKEDIEKVGIVPVVFEEEPHDHHAGSLA